MNYKIKINEWTDGFIKAWYIAKKDIKVYFFKAPNFTYSLLIPISLFLAFSIGTKINPIVMISGLTAIVILFGTTSIEAVSVVLEKQTGTFERLLTAPISFFYIILGKALAGTLFGLSTAIIIIIPLILISGTFIINPYLIVVAIITSSLCFSALGVLISTYAKWVPEAQMISNFIRFPMVFICGTFISFELLPIQQRIIASFLPLTYSIETLRSSISEPIISLNYIFNILILTLFTFVFLIMAVFVLKKRIT